MGLENRRLFGPGSGILEGTIVETQRRKWTVCLGTRQLYSHEHQGNIRNAQFEENIDAAGQKPKLLRSSQSVTEVLDTWTRVELEVFRQKGTENKELVKTTELETWKWSAGSAEEDPVRTQPVEETKDLGNVEDDVEV